MNRIHIFYWHIQSRICCNLCDRVGISFTWIWLAMACGLLWHWSHGQSNNDGTFQGNEVCQVLLFQCGYTLFLCWSCSYIFYGVGHCEVPHLVQTVLHPWPVEDLPLIQHLMHLFCSIELFFIVEFHSCILLDDGLCLFCIAIWCMLFHVYSAFADIILYNGSHNSAVTDENLPK